MVTDISLRRLKVNDYIKKCKPCEGVTQALSMAQIEALILTTKNWELHSNKLVREYSFMNFEGALTFVNRVGKLAELEGHHPDILMHDYKYVTLSLWTHALKGLSENDFILAAEINNIR